MSLVSRSSGSRHRLASFRDLGIEYPLTADAYELETKVGTGGSATVWRARCKTLDTVVALKLVELEELHTALELLIREAHTMMSLRHPNVLHLLGSFISGETLWLVMPFISGGSLSRVLQTQFPRGMDEGLIVTIARDVLRGLEYLHRHELAHRDLKADNLLIHEEGRILLADFGATAKLERIEFSQPLGSSGQSTPSLAAIAESPDTSVHSSTAFGSEGSTPLRSASSTSSWSRYLSRQTFVGTPNYMAPEVMLQNDDGYNQSADIWSFGIVLLELARGKVPLQNCSFTKIIIDTVHGPAPCLDEGSNHFSKGLCNLVARCLNKEAHSRPSAAELLKDPIFKHAHDSKWLAKRLLGASAAEGKAGGRRVKFRDGKEGTPPTSTSPSQTVTPTYRAMPTTSLFSRASSKSLNSAGEAAADAHRHKLVHNLAWAFLYSGRSYIMVYELSQWFGKARVFIEGHEIMVKRYSFLQQLTFSHDDYHINVDNPALGPLHGCAIHIRVAAQLGLHLMGMAQIDGKDLPLPVYCERESLRTSASGQLMKSGDSSSSASHSPLSLLDSRPSSSTDSIASLSANQGADTSKDSEAPSEAHLVRDSLHKVSLSSIPEANIAEVPSCELPVTVPSPFSAFAAQQSGEPWPVPGSPSDSSAGVSPAAHDSAVAFGAAFRAAEQAEASLYIPQVAALAPDLEAAPGGSAAAADGGPADTPQREEAVQGPCAQSAGTSTANGWQDEVQDKADLDRMIEAAVEARVSAEVVRLRQEFAKREQMLMTAVMGHSERERELHDRVRVLEKLAAAQHHKPDLAHEA